MPHKNVLINNVTRQEFEKSVQLSFNHFGIKVKGFLSDSTKDTNYRYDLFTDEKLSKAKLLSLFYFIRGVVYTLRSF